MRRDDFSFAKNCLGSRLALGALLICVVASLSALAAPQADSDVPPDATPQVQQIKPDQAAPGTKVTVVIQGSNFSGGAYVSSVSAAIHVDSSKRVSATQLEAQLSVSASAQPSTLSLLVSNPASRAAEAVFKIVAGEAPAAPAKEVEPPKPAAPVAPPAPSAPAAPEAPAPPAAEVKPSAPAPPPAPAAPTAPPVAENPAAPPAPAVPAPPATPAAPAAPPAAENPAAPPAPPAPAAPAAPPGPEVTTIAPPRVGPGFDMVLKITGKNFVQGAKVSFANPGIRVMGITSPSSTELTVHIRVARDAAPGVASLYVINPDDSEVESPFEVTGKGAAPPSTPPSPAPPATADSAGTQRYDAFHLGNPAEIFQVHGKVKGALVVSAGTITYQEDGKTLINIQLSDIKEIKTSAIPSTFHIALTSGKTYHFAPGSLRPADARSLVETLRKALPQ